MRRPILPNREDQSPSNTPVWALLYEPEGMRNGNCYYRFGSNVCIALDEGGSLTSIEKDGDDIIARYDAGCTTYGSRCPSGAIVKMTDDRFSAGVWIKLAESARNFNSAFSAGDNGVIDPVSGELTDFSLEKEQALYTTSDRPAGTKCPSGVFVQISQEDYNRFYRRKEQYNDELEKARQLKARLASA